MKIFLSAVEHGGPMITISKMLNENFKFKYNLMSFFYIQDRNYEFVEKLRDRSELILVDSGAHSFQKGKKVDWEQYTKQYAEFIKKFDRPNVLGYFEMDVDNIIGYDRVLELRKILESVSDKIIPVWHKNRGIEEYQKMCQDYAGKVIAITGFRNEDIKDEQYLMFLKYAKKYNCKVHCLGMTRKQILDKIPFDYADSSSWCLSVLYGRDMNGNKLPKAKCQDDRDNQIKHNYLLGMEMQRKYYNKWKKVCKD